MPKLITRKKDASSAQAVSCNFSDPSQNEFMDQQVTIEELRMRCTRYRDYLASLEPPQENTMIRAANFTTESVLRLIQQSPGSEFVRVYYGINESGQHGLFMAPVAAAGTTSSTTSASTTETTSLATETTTLATEEETIYADDCCHCPPMGNCTGDELLTPQP